jgi:hypothetical protein
LTPAYAGATNNELVRVSLEYDSGNGRGSACGNKGCREIPAAVAKHLLLEGVGSVLLDLLRLMLLLGGLGDRHTSRINRSNRQDGKDYDHYRMDKHIQTSSKFWFEPSLEQ